MIRTLAHAAPHNLSDTDAANAYAHMTHRPHNYTVELAYLNFKHETLAQWDDIMANGLDVSFYTDSDPYTCRSASMFEDIDDFGHLSTFKTLEDQGLPLDHAMLQYVDREAYCHGTKFNLRLNDVFRAVHDVNGHHASRSSFGPQGEKTAWLTHRQRYTQSALTALWCETRGQASWTNFYDGHEYLPQCERPFAQQKTGLPDSDLI
jgi:hypothetical protein